MIMLKAKTDNLKCDKNAVNLSIIVDGDMDECVTEMVLLLDKLTEQQPRFMEAVINEMVKREKERRRK